MPKKIDPAVKERALRMVAEHRGEPASPQSLVETSCEATTTARPRRTTTRRRTRASGNSHCSVSFSALKRCRRHRAHPTAACTRPGFGRSDPQTQRAARRRNPHRARIQREES